MVRFIKFCNLFLKPMRLVLLDKAMLDELTMVVCAQHATLNSYLEPGQDLIYDRKTGSCSIVTKH